MVALGWSTSLGFFVETTSPQLVNAHVTILHLSDVFPKTIPRSWHLRRSLGTNKRHFCAGKWCESFYRSKVLQLGLIWGQYMTPAKTMHYFFQKAKSLRIVSHRHCLIHLQYSYLNDTLIWNFKKAPGVAFTTVSWLCLFNTSGRGTDRQKLCSFPNVYVF